MEEEEIAREVDIPLSGFSGFSGTFWVSEVCLSVFSSVSLSQVGFWSLVAVESG